MSSKIPIDKKPHSYFFNEDGHRYYYREKRFHRLDGPAVISASGSKYWFINGRRHRTDGPAIELSTGWCEWWVNGQWCDFPSEFQQAARLTDEDMAVLILKYGK